MDPATLIGLGGALGGFLGGIFSAGDRQKALQLHKDELQRWMDLKIPDPEQQKLFLQRYVQTGELAPEMVEAAQQKDTNLKSVSTAPSPAQMRALQAMEQQGLAGGLDLNSKVALEEANNAANTAARGRNEALVNEFAQRGQGGSGLELQARMMGNQGANQMQAANSMNAAASARQRALESLMGAGTLGGQMQQQQYAQKSNAAKAQDYIDQYNTQNTQRTREWNTGARNDAQKYNLGLKQDISNKNVGLSNEEQTYNKNLYQKQYANEIAKLNGISGANTGLANAYTGQANNTAAMWKGLGSSADQWATGVWGDDDDEDED